MKTMPTPDIGNLLAFPFELNLWMFDTAMSIHPILGVALIFLWIVLAMYIVKGMCENW